MQEEAALAIVAEVPVALAGFTGVVAAFGSHGRSTWSPIDLMRFRIMLGTSLAAPPRRRTSRLHCNREGE